ncbi:MAG: cation:proton antiporter domain-containing protein, partial [Anaerolineae bacterium]
LIILIAFIIVTMSRAVVVLLVTAMLHKKREAIPFSWSLILTWGGLRGALPMVLILSLSTSLPHRALLVNMTFGVVLLSILVQGLTISPLMRWLGVISKHVHQDAYEFARGKLQAANAALDEIKRMAYIPFTRDDVRERLKGEYSRRIEQEQKRISELQLDQEAISAEEAQWARRHLLLTEKNHIMDAFQQGLLEQDVYDRLMIDIDARFLRLESGGQDEPEAESPPEPPPAEAGRS